MLKEELPGGDKPTGNTWARVCDGRLRVGYPAASRHERVWGVCEACERAPAAFHCKADAASLCADCDAEVHSANPLARRHHRVPILPLSGYLYGAAATNPGSRSVAMVPMGETEDGFDEEDEEEAASWLLLNPSNKKGNTTTTINGCFLGGEVDEYLDLVDYNDPETDTCQFRGENYNQDNTQLSHHEHEYIVPVAIGEGKDVHDNRSFQMGLDYEVKSEFAYNNSLSTCHSVSVSSLDMGIVPDTSTSTISTPHSKPSKGTIDLFSSDPLKQTPTQLSPMDREAKVLRYRQKKKTRKFEKTIRYASRKAYAETRPRIKGRFAKRSKIEVEVDQMFSDTVMADLGYGIVPSF